METRLVSSSGDGKGDRNVKCVSGHSPCAAVVALQTVLGDRPEIIRRHAPALVPSSTQIAPAGWMPKAGWAVVTDVRLVWVTWPKKAPPPPSQVIISLTGVTETASALIF